MLVTGCANRGPTCDASSAQTVTALELFALFHDS